MSELVYVEWIDSSSVDTWVEITDYDNKLSYCKTAGFLTYEDNDCITVTPTISDSHYNAPMTIPKFAITERRKLG